MDQHLLTRLENDFPGQGQWMAELINPFRSIKSLMTLQPRLVDLGRELTKEIPWRPISGIEVWTEYPDSLTRLLYKMPCEEFPAMVAKGLVHPGDGVVERVTLWLKEEFDWLEEFQVDSNDRLRQLMMLGDDPEVKPLMNQLLTRKNLARNFWKLLWATILARLANNPKFDCSVVLDRWQQGNLLYGISTRTGQALNMCAPSERTGLD